MFGSAPVPDFGEKTEELQLKETHDAWRKYLSDTGKLNSTEVGYCMELLDASSDGLLWKSIPVIAKYPVLLKKRVLDQFKTADEKNVFVTSHPHLPLAHSRMQHAALLLQATKTQGIETMQRMAVVLQKEYDSVGTGGERLSPAAQQAKFQQYSNAAYMILLIGFVLYFFFRGG